MSKSKIKILFMQLHLRTVVRFVMWLDNKPTGAIYIPSYQAHQLENLKDNSSSLNWAWHAVLQHCLEITEDKPGKLFYLMKQIGSM